MLLPADGCRLYTEATGRRSKEDRRTLLVQVRAREKTVQALRNGAHGQLVRYYQGGSAGYGTIPFCTESDAPDLAVAHTARDRLEAVRLSRDDM